MDTKMKVSCEITNLLHTGWAAYAEATLSIDGKPILTAVGRSICNPNDLKIATARAKKRAYKQFYKNKKFYKFLNQL